MLEGFSGEAKAAIAAAHEMAERLSASATGSDHLLFGLTTTTSPASRVLATLGILPGTVEAALTQGCTGALEIGNNTRGWTRGSRDALAECLSNRLQRRDPAINTEHLTMAVANRRYGHGATIIEQIIGEASTNVQTVLANRLGFSLWTERSMDPAEPGSDPVQAALHGFRPEENARAVSIRFTHYDEAVVQVGFPQKSASYFLTIKRQGGKWAAAA